jgi:magnesium transporter
MSIKGYFLTPEGNLQTNLTRLQIQEAFTAQQGLLWVDFSEITEEEGRFLEQNLGFHHLAVEDCVSTEIHSPKIDNFDDYLFVVVHGINHAIESDTVETAELALFIGENYMVSNHNFPLYSVSAVQQKIEENDRLMRRGVDLLAHTLVDTLIDNVLPTIDRMTDFAEEIEEEVIHQPQQIVLDAIMKLKRAGLRVHRVMAPQRDVINRLSRGEFPIIKKDSQIFYRDIYDHVVRIEDLVQSLLDRSDNALATYLSSVANRQNETMRVLSIVATIFMPLTLLVGIYGMNFDYMPELTWRWGYFMVLGIIGFVVLVLIWRFWASGWFAWGRRRMTWVKPFMVEGKKIQGYLTANLKLMSRHKLVSDSEENDGRESNGWNNER